MKPSENFEKVAATAIPAACRASRHRGETIAKVGTIVSAIMASACCWLPLLLLALGVSGAGIASTLEAYRPLFIVVTFGFLAAAFYFTYRPKKPNAADDCCPPATGRKFNIMTLNKVILWIVTVMAVAFLFFPSYVGALVGAGKSNAVNSDMRQTVVNIEGMTCEGCAAIVAKAIQSVPGVQGVSVSYEKRRAIVGTDRPRPVSNEEILAALKQAGYSGSVAEAPLGATPPTTVH